MEANKHVPPSVADDVAKRYLHVKAEVLDGLVKEFDARVDLADMDVREDDVDNHFNDIDGPQPMFGSDIQFVDQMVLPVVLGFETPMSVEDTNVVLQHLKRDDEHVARKLAGAFTLANTGRPGVRANHPCLLGEEALQERLAYVAKHMPVLVTQLVEGSQDPPPGFPRER
jgi:hypothetical protein